jgi:hypothetical protein
VHWATVIYTTLATLPVEPLSLQRNPIRAVGTVRNLTTKILGNVAVLDEILKKVSRTINLSSGSEHQHIDILLPLQAVRLSEPYKEISRRLLDIEQVVQQREC